MARLIYFPQTDERPTPPPPLNIDEDSDGWWAGAQRCFVAVPIASAIAGIALSASLCWGLQQQTDEIIPKVEEEYWHVVTAPPPLPSFLYLPDPEEVPAGVLRQLDEQYWQVYTPPPLPAQPLYLPDPEEVPAGSLHGPSAENALPLPPTPPAARRVQAWPANA